ncbi:MAG: methyltransferase domain-containing protein [Chloroflexota bacterium]|nr:methyltransferase domain-containing protein [Chloroflexota bacterium]
MVNTQQYEYVSAAEAWADRTIASRIIQALTDEPNIRRVMDAGCGNGNLSARIAAAGFDVTGFDASASGIEHARRAFPGLRFEVASAYDDFRERLEVPFDACACVEVIEHLYDPRAFVDRVHQALRPGGLFVVTTPYHGYIKNLALAMTGATDSHYSALWDGGHIKFWSRATLTTLLEERGFRVIRFEGTGRVPFLWKSMIVTARKVGSN